MIALILSFFLIGNSDMTTETKDCGCGGHDETKEENAPCPCAKARRKKIIILGIVAIAAIGASVWAWKTGKLTSLWAWVNTPSVKK